MKGLSVTVVLVACATAVGCGSNGNKTDVNCGPFTACGGDIVGTWRYVSACTTFSSATCSAETVMTTSASGSVTYTFGSGGVFTSTSSGTLHETIDYAPGCLSGLTDAGAPQACADLQNAFRMSIGQDAGSSPVQLMSATCSVGPNDTCNCTLVFGVQSATMQGTYTITGSQVTINDADGGAGTPADFCVSGNTLTLQLSTNSGSNGVVTLTR